MKKLLFFIVAILGATALQAQPARLSPLTRKYLQEAAAANSGIPDGYVYRKGADGQMLVGALIQVTDAQAADAALSALGVHTGTKAGNIWTVKIPADQVAAFINTPGISYIQLDEPVQSNLDVVRASTRTDSVHNGIGLPMRYSGKNVVVGVIDFGFDYSHPTFYDTLGQQHRVKKVWELGGTGTPPAGYTYGREISSTALMLTQGTDNPKQTHGTGVVGIAAGSGYGSPQQKYRGMAYESDLVLVGVRRDSIATQWRQGGFSDFVDGINYIFQYATSVNQPAVVNISWGGHSGPHDGSSLFNQACDNLSGIGKIIVMSAGNDGQDKIHLSKKFTATDTVLGTFLEFAPAHYQRTWIDVWGEPGKTFCAEVQLYHNGLGGPSSGYICIDDQSHTTYLLGANGTDTCYVEVFTSAAEFNGKPRVTVSVYNKSTDSIAFRLRGNDGTVHLWNEYYYYGFPNKYKSTFSNYGFPWALSGNTTSTTSDMGSAASVLLVGAYASKTDYTDINGKPFSYNGYASTGRIAPFSSRGPMVNGQVKPDITAPGLTLATAYTSFDTSYTATGSNSTQVVNLYTHPVSGRVYPYGEFIGTSASAPVATGIVALMLQAHPQLSPQDVKNILSKTAIRDIYTGALPANGNNTWGQGKINAYGAVKQSLIKSGTYTFAGAPLSCILYPNPNKGNFILEYADDKSEALAVEVYNLTGQLLVTHNWNTAAGTSFPLDLTAYAKGMYLVRISSANGSISIKTLTD